MPDQNEKQLESWLNLPSQWGYMVPPDLLAMEDATHSLLPDEELMVSAGSCWESPYRAGAVWTKTGDSTVPSFGTKEPSRDLEQLPYGDLQGSSVTPGAIMLGEEQHPWEPNLKPLKQNPTMAPWPILVNLSKTPRRNCSTYQQPSRNTSSVKSSRSIVRGIASRMLCAPSSRICGSHSRLFTTLYRLWLQHACRTIFPVC